MIMILHTQTQKHLHTLSERHTQQHALILTETHTQQHALTQNTHNAHTYI